MKPLLPPAIGLLFVVLLFPGLSWARYVSQEGTEDPKAPAEGTNGSHLLRQQVKRYVFPHTPPYEEPAPDFKVVNCRKSKGQCQEYCNYMETQLGYCAKKKNACCLHQ
uniref:Beta-defensin-like domain-containing protein n=1 Tax=Rhinolophus ferrumequinum TaxID=59479 RepID=A0A671FDH5_RHIFE